MGSVSICGLKFESPVLNSAAAVVPPDLLTRPDDQPLAYNQVLTYAFLLPVTDQGDSPELYLSEAWHRCASVVSSSHEAAADKVLDVQPAGSGMAGSNSGTTTATTGLDTSGASSTAGKDDTASTSTSPQGLTAEEQAAAAKAAADAAAAAKAVQEQYQKTAQQVHDELLQQYGSTNGATTGPSSSFLMTLLVLVVSMVVARR